MPISFLWMQLFTWGEWNISDFDILDMEPVDAGLYFLAWWALWPIIWIPQIIPGILLTPVYIIIGIVYFWIWLWPLFSDPEAFNEQVHHAEEFYDETVNNKTT